MLKCVYDQNQVGMFVWAKVPDNVSNVEEFVENILQKAGVFITPGFVFGSNGERYVRISLCSKVEVLNEAKNRIKSFLEK